MESDDEYRARLTEEFTVCRRRFAELFGVSPVSFCWPWGDHNAVALEEAKRAGFRVFFSTGIGSNGPKDALAVKRFKVFQVSGKRLMWETAALSIAPLAKLAGRLAKKASRVNRLKSFFLCLSLVIALSTGCATRIETSPGQSVVSRADPYVQIGQSLSVRLEDGGVSRATAGRSYVSALGEECAEIDGHPTVKAACLRDDVWVGLRDIFKASPGEENARP
jgi:hypothetical protein